MIAIQAFLTAGLFFLSLPGRAEAYVDPGLLGSLYQVGYVVVFGALFALVTGPARLARWAWDAVMRLFGRGGKKQD